MTAVIVPFETPAQREERLYRECEAAYQTYGAERTQANHEALLEAVQRWEAARMTLRLRKSA